MTKLTIINQPYDDRVGDHLVSLLMRQTNAFDSARIACAFAKSSGVSRIFDALQAFASRGSLEIMVGVDHQRTSRQSLELLLQTGGKVYVFHNPASDFHPKLYLFKRGKLEGVAIVGSSNLTCGGLYENYEFNVRLDFDLTKNSEAKTFKEEFMDRYDHLIDTTTGLVLPLDQKLLRNRNLNRNLIDEIESVKQRIRARHRELAVPSLFRRVASPRAPPPTRRISLPSIPREKDRPIATFAMKLGPRDTRQRPGYSRDMYIPIEARNNQPTFWEWPRAYQQTATRTKGTFLDRRINLLVNPARGRQQLVRNVRMYWYAERDEFRLNCGQLVEGSRPSDLLIIHKMPEGLGYDYEASVIPQGRPMYSAFLATCVNQVPRSQKRWGYS